MPDVGPTPITTADAVAALAQIERDQVFEYMTRWCFESMLDRLANQIAAFLRNRISGPLECSIFYRANPADPALPHRYRLGGASVLRTRINPETRTYLVGGETRRPDSRRTPSPRDAIWHSTTLTRRWLPSFPWPGGRTNSVSSSSERSVVSWHCRSTVQVRVRYRPPSKTP